MSKLDNLTEALSNFICEKLDGITIRPETKESIIKQMPEILKVQLQLLEKEIMTQFLLLQEMDKQKTPDNAGVSEVTKH